MTAFRDLLCFVSAVSALVVPVAHAQVTAKSPGAWQSGWHQSSRSPLGLHLGGTQAAFPCGATALICDASDRTAHLQASAMVGKYWGLEVGYAETGRAAAGESRAHGMNLSLVGKAPLGPSLGVYGKVGTTYGRADTSVLGAGPAPFTEPGFGVSYGAGLSYSFTPRLSATIEWDSNDFRFPGTGREPVRSTSLGLRYRY